MHFVLMFKIDVLGTSRERHPPDVTLNKIKNNAMKMHFVLQVQNQRPGNVPRTLLFGRLSGTF